MKRKGFTYIEAILAIVLVSIATLFRAGYETERAHFEKANDFGKDLASILTAIDKKILLDGRADQVINPTTGAVTKGNWTSTWGSNSIVIEQMLQQELIGFENSVCGDTTLGWRPKVSENNDKALVDCNLFSGGVPFDFEIRAAREPLDSANTHIISKWDFQIFNADDYDFAENFKFYAEIIKAVRLNDSIRMTGSHDVILVDRSMSPEVELSGLSECYAAKSNCAIVFRYKNSHISETTKDAYMRVDGSLGMLDDLTFKTTAGIPERCFNNNEATVSCGFDFDITDGSVDLYSNVINAETFHLIYEDLTGGTAPIKAMCNEGADEDTKPCGITVADELGSVIVSAYFDKLYARELFLNNIETDHPIIVRKSLDDNDNLMTFSKDGLTYKDETNGTKSIKFSDDIVFNSDKTFSIKSSGVNLESSGSTTITSQKGMNINSVNGVDITTTDGTSKAITKAEALQGVRVMSMDIINSGSTVNKKSCPFVEGAAPAIQAITHPSYGHNTNIRSVGADCDVNSSEFIEFNVASPVIRLFTWTGSEFYSDGAGNFRNADYIQAQSSYNMKIKCDPQRDSAISYQVDNYSSTKWRPRLWFWGGSTSSERSNIPMTVIQYCDYSR